MIQTRPIVNWPGAMTPHAQRQRGRYSAGAVKTRKELVKELEHVKAREAFIQAAYSPEQIRLDGMPKAGARPDHPGIIVTYTDQAGEMFDFACDTFLDAEQNLRAIVLTLQRLRLIDETGMQTAARQYQGFKRLDAKPAGPGMPADVHEAAALLARFAGPEVTPLGILTDRATLDHAYRAASTRAHPDTGGGLATFRGVARAREILNAHHDEAKPCPT